MKTNTQKILYTFLSMLLPILIIATALFRSGIYPFGDNTLVYHDMQYQYTDFFMWFHHVLHGEDSLTYSFNSGMGANMIALIAYYLASPLNLLILLVPVERIAEFLTVLIVLKLALCGLTAYIYLQKRFEIHPFYSILIATSYALMGYNILQCSNVMWLDGVIILPILALGIYRSIYLNKYRMYFFALLYAIVSNWYIGYMLCLFACIYFVVETLLYYENHKFQWKNVGISVINFGVNSLLALFGSCFLFLPQLLQMTQRGEELDTNVFLPAYNFSYLEGFRDLFLQEDKLTRMEYIPPIFIGTFVLMTVVLFFIAKNISKYKKIVLGILLFGFMFSLSYKPLNYLFTGLKIPNNHYYRQAFLFSFIMIVIAGVCLKEGSDKINAQFIFRTMMIVLGMALIFDLVKNYQPRTQIYVSCFMILLIGTIWILLIKNPQAKIRILLNLLLVACLMTEFSNKMVMEFQDHEEGVSDYTEYNQAMRESLEKLKEVNENNSAYRIDKTFCRTVNSGFGNESMAFLYSSLSQYSSTNNADVAIMMNYLGYGNDSKVVPYFPILPIDSLLGVKYIYAKSEVLAGKVLDTGILNDISLYENPYALPLAYEVDSACEDIEWTDNVFINQELIYNDVLGKDIKLYNYPSDVQQETDYSSWTEWKIKVETDGPLYCYFHNNSEGMTTEVNGQILWTNVWYDNHIMYLGEHQAGDIVTVKVYGGEYREDYGIQTATLQMENFENAIQELKNQACTVTKREQKQVIVEYECEEPSKVMLTIPFEKDWVVKVNNQIVNYQKIAGGFIGVEVPGGENVITMEYQVSGLKAGWGLTILGIVGFSLCEYIRKKKRYLQS